MPRRARLRIEGLPLHIMQRGNNRCACFFEPGDYCWYLDLLTDRAAAHDCAVHAYVLMTNHVHLLLTPERADGASWLMKDMAQRYAQRVNHFRKRTGSLWEGRFRSCIVDSDLYLLTCQRYIEMNPVRAGIVNHPADYAWSSYRANAHGTASTCLKPHPQIRHATQGGFALGSEAFVDRLADELGIRPVRLSP